MSLSIARSDLQRLVNIACETSDPDVRASIKRAAANTARVAFGASHVRGVGCIGTQAAVMYGRPKAGTFDGPAFDALLEHHFGINHSGVTEVIDD